MRSWFTALLLLPGAAASAGEVSIVDARAVPAADGSYRFAVTLSHADTGWEHYADGWVVEDADGTVLGRRELLHPHVDEQPFTRHLDGVRIPTAIQSVFIQAHDSVHGDAPQRLRIDLPDRARP